MTRDTKVVIGLLMIAFAGSALFFMADGEDTYALRDIDGISHGSLTNPETSLTILLFMNTSCPISMQYAPEIISICDDYRSKGAGCFLVYPESGLTPEALKEHLQAFGHNSPAMLDTD